MIDNREEINVNSRYPSVMEQSFLYITSTGKGMIKQEELLAEYPLKVYINNKFVTTLTCTPIDIEAMVLGCLFTEGMIHGLEEIDSIEYREDDFSVHVRSRSVISQTAKMHCLQQEVILRPEWIFSMAEVFEKDTILHQRTYGTHSCFLGIQGKVLYSCEDIGRHNAIDKVIGMAIKDGIDLTQTMIFTSGRIPVDMVEKVIRAKIPVFITKAKPTIQSIECAKKYGLILVGSARSDSFKVYTSINHAGV